MEEVGFIACNATSLQGGEQDALASLQSKIDSNIKMSSTRKQLLIN